MDPNSMYMDPQHCYLDPTFYFFYLPGFLTSSMRILPFLSAILYQLTNLTLILQQPHSVMEKMGRKDRKLLNKYTKSM